MRERTAGCIGEMFRSDCGRLPRSGPRDVVDRQPGRGRHGPGRYPGEGHDVSVEVGLVGVTAVGRDQGGAVTRGQAVGRVVEPDELGRALRGEADLGPEPGPQALAAPSSLGRQLLDADLSPAGHHLPPGEGDFPVDPPACLMPADERASGIKPKIP